MSGAEKRAAAADNSQSEALNFRLPPALMQALKTAANKDGVRVSDIVRQALEHDMFKRAHVKPERAVTLAELDRRMQQLLDQQASILIYQTGSVDAAHTSALQGIKILTALSLVMQALGLDPVTGQAVP